MTRHSGLLSTCSRLAFLVSLIRLPDADREEATRAVFGTKLPGPFARLFLAGSWVRTSQGFVQVMMDYSLQAFTGTWPAWGISSGGQSTALSMLELPTSATGIGSSVCWPTPIGHSAREMNTRYAQGGLPLTLAVKLWPTPVAPGEGNRKIPRGSTLNGRTIRTPKGRKVQFNLENAVEREGVGAEIAAALWRTPNTVDAQGGRRYGKGQVQLCHQVRAWPTPTANGATGSGGQSGQGGLNLQSAVATWPTPTGTDHKGQGQVNRRPATDDDLTSRVLRVERGRWPTPAGRDRKGRQEGGFRRDGGPALPDAVAGASESPVSGGSGEMLNPDWVEQLMGVPRGWSEIAGPLDLGTFKRTGKPRGRRGASRAGGQG